MTKFLNISTDTTLGGNSASDDVVSSQKALKTYIDNHSGGGGSLPSQTGHSGEFLTTDGTDASWGVVKTNDLFDNKWTDYLLNDQNWLRADTYSWQDGTVYSNAYNHLVDDIASESITYYAWTNSSIPRTYYTLSSTPSTGDAVYDSSFLPSGKTVKSYASRTNTILFSGGTEFYSRDSSSDVTQSLGPTTQTETVGSYTITYVLADDGHKITTDESTVANIYAESGVAWYYVLDTANTRFKLPRENPVREELIQIIRAKGNGMTLGTTNGTTNYGLTTLSSGQYGGETATYGQPVGTARGGSSSGQISAGLTTDSTKSGIISDMTDSTSVYKGAKYLYFYVGNFSQSATEQTAGLNAELFNGKMDLDMSNMNASSIAKETIVGWGIPDYTAGTSLSLTTGQTYTATYNQMICGIVGWGTSQAGEILVRTTNDTSSMSNIIFAGRGSNYDWGAYHLYLKKGQSIYVQSLNGTYSCTVYPLIGS